MNEAHIHKIAVELKVHPRQVAATAKLFAEGATVPFIARYRKESTGSFDEVVITSIRERLLNLTELDQRREAILKSLAERNLLTESLKSAIAGTETLTALEDIFQPYRPKRRTRAIIAKELGLEPLADLLFKQQSTADPNTAAQAYVNAEKGVPEAAAALAGARDILAERISDDAHARAKLRELFWDNAVVKSKVMSGKEEAAAKFKDYFNWNEPVARIPSHRMLAIRRGESEGLLMIAWAYLGDQWVQCRPNQTLNLDGRTEKELKIATLEWRRSSQLLGHRQSSSHKNLAEFLKTAQQNKAIQVQQAKDRALRMTRVPPADAMPIPAIPVTADKPEPIDSEVSPTPTSPEALSQASPTSDYGDF